MFRKLWKFSTLAVVARLASALVVQIPETPTSGGQITIRWTNEPNDPETWTFELINTAFNNAFAIANNVNPSASELTLTLPVVPVGDGYTLQAVNIGDISQVYASTGTFSIGASTTSTSTASSTTASSVSGSSTVVTSSTASRSLSTPVSVPRTSTSPSSTGTGTGAGTAATITPSTAGALSSRLGLNAPVGGIALAFISAVAGAAMIAF